MKKYLYIVALMAFATPSISFANSVAKAQPVAPISVELSMQSATLIVQEEVNIHNGVFTLILPSGINLGSMMISTLGMDIAKKELNLIPIPAKNFPLFKQKTNLLKRIEQVTVKIYALDARIKVLSSSQQVFTSSKDINSLDTALGNRFELLYAQKNTLVEQKQNLIKSLAEINRALISATGTADPYYKQIIVSLANKKINGQHKISYSYVINNAGWRPVYQVFADLEKKSVSALFAAEMWQSTAVAWNNVPVIITTATPIYGAEPLPLQNWIVNAYNPQPRNTNANKAQSMALMHADSPPVYLQENAITVTWNVGKQSFLEGEKRVASISKTTWDANFHYTLRPFSTNEAFLTATLENNEKLDIFLPGGTASFFVGKSAIGQGSFVYTPQAKQVVYFGSDPLVTATMNLVDDTLVVNKKEQKKSWVWDIRVYNRRAVTINVVLEDSRPITRSPQVSISLAGSTPMPVVTPSAVEWDLKDLKPKTVSSVKYMVSATAPLDVEITSPR